MRKSVLVLAAIAGLGVSEAPAAAQSGQWCQLDDRMSPVNCSFVSFEQCRATVIGVGGLCAPNLAAPQRVTAPQRARRAPQRAH